jgi:hypothetical protein
VCWEGASEGGIQFVEGAIAFVDVDYGTLVDARENEMRFSLILCSCTHLF